MHLEMNHSNWECLVHIHHCVPWVMNHWASQPTTKIRRSLAPALPCSAQTNERNHRKAENKQWRIQSRRRNPAKNTADTAHWTFKTIHRSHKFVYQRSSKWHTRQTRKINALTTCGRWNSKYNMIQCKLFSSFVFLAPVRTANNTATNCRAQQQSQQSQHQNKWWPTRRSLNCDCLGSETCVRVSYAW